MSLSVIAQFFLVPALALGGARGEATDAITAGETTVLPPRVTRAGPIRTLNGFVENKGQWSSDVLFFAREGRIEATLFQSGLALRMSADLPTPRELESGTFEAPALLPPLFLHFVYQGAPAHAKAVEGVGELATRHNFFLGARSGSSARGFGEVLYRDVAPGIDVRVRTSGGAFAYDLLVAPAADLEGLSIEVEGADSIEALGDGALAMLTPAGLVEHRIGASWQVDLTSGEREPLAARFLLLAAVDGRARFVFEAPGWDPSTALVIDPSLVYATYIGGGNQELLETMAVDAAGSAFLGCWGGSGTPTTPSSFQPGYNGENDAWVGKLSPDGSRVVWGTYLGGSKSELDVRIAVDADGSIVVAGSTWSTDFPTMPGCLQPVSGSLPDKGELFIARLDSMGSSLVWSTYFGGPDHENTRALALFPSGDVLVAADPLFGSLPATPGAFDPTFDAGDQMLLRVSADGSSLVFLTYFKTTRILDVAIDPESNIYFCGDVQAVDAPIPTTPGVFKAVFPPGPKGEAFVAKMSGAGTQLAWATYLGGDEDYDTAWGIALDAARAVYITGQTHSNNFPVTPGAFDTSINGAVDGFVTKLLPGGSGTAWSTYLGAGPSPSGGSGHAWDVAVDVAGNPHVVGDANEPGWPTTLDAFQPFFIGPSPYSDTALTKLDATGGGLVYSTWFGAGGTDYFPLVGLDGAGHPHQAFLSFSPDIPVTAGAYDSTYGGTGDMVAAEFDLPLLPWRVLGGGLKGLNDTPNLAGTGLLISGALTRLSVRGASPNKPAWAVLGFSELHLPILGGTLVPWPDYIFPFATSASGAIDVTFAWPADFVPGMTVVFQFWVLDAGAPFGFSATNGLNAIP